jgi:hypothetical protein
MDDDNRPRATRCDAQVPRAALGVGFLARLGGGLILPCEAGGVAHEPDSDPNRAKQESVFHVGCLMRVSPCRRFFQRKKTLGGRERDRVGGGTHSRPFGHGDAALPACGCTRSWRGIKGEVSNLTMDWTGMVETELFAQTYKSYGLATVRHPVLEVARQSNRSRTGGDFRCE